MVVVGIENPAQNDASGQRHARVTLTRYLHVRFEVTPESPVTATVPGKVVVLRIKRLLQHHMRSGNVWGGSKLVSRSCYVQIFTNSAPSSTLGIFGRRAECNGKPLIITDIDLPRVS